MEDINQLVLGVELLGERVLSHPRELMFVGKGRSAVVFKIRETDKVVKIFFEKNLDFLEKEYKAYKKVDGLEGYLRCYGRGKNFIVIDYIEGTTFYEFLTNGYDLKESYVDTANDYLKIAKNRGLNPNDVHLKNIMVDKNGKVKIIDLARFVDKKIDRQWDDIYRTYKRFYKNKFIPKRIPRLVIDLIGKSYKGLERYIVKDDLINESNI